MRVRINFSGVNTVFTRFQFSDHSWLILSDTWVPKMLTNRHDYSFAVLAGLTDQAFRIAAIKPLAPLMIPPTFSEIMDVPRFTTAVAISIAVCTVRIVFSAPVISLPASLIAANWLLIS